MESVDAITLGGGEGDRLRRGDPDLDRERLRPLPRRGERLKSLSMALKVTQPARRRARVAA